jgi:homoserine dehydrogenase
MESMNVGMIGCGTVGSAVACLLLEKSARICQRTGKNLVLRRVVVRDPIKPRIVSLPNGILAADPAAVYDDPHIQVAVELIGGVEPARTIILRCLAAGKDVVTANKAVLAAHGDEIFQAAHRQGRTVAFEGSVAGGITIISAIGQGLAANRILSIKAILNGTSNFILTRMTEQGQSYAEALAEAQRQGLAEADPTLDVSGADAAHKLAVLARVAFGIAIPPDHVERRGINSLSQADIRFADEMGYVIKLLAEVWQDDNQVALHVEPTLVRKLSPLAEVRGVYNAVHVVGDVVGDALYYGKGAGAMPTASAVVADLIDLAVGRAQATFQVLKLWQPHPEMHHRPSATIRSRFYLRVNVHDRPTVLAEVAGALGRHEIRIASVRQQEALDEHSGVANPVVIMTQPARIRAFRTAAAEIDQLSCVVAPSVYFPVAED